MRKSEGKPGRPPRWVTALGSLGCVLTACGVPLMIWTDVVLESPRLAVITGILAATGAAAMATDVAGMTAWAIRLMPGDPNPRGGSPERKEGD